MSLPVKRVDDDVSSVSTIAVSPSNNVSRHGSDSHTLPPLEEHPTQKKSSHIDRNDLIRDAIIGFADGLTVPFALTAGLSA